MKYCCSKCYGKCGILYSTNKLWICDLCWEKELSLENKGRLLEHKNKKMSKLAKQIKGKNMGLGKALKGKKGKK